MTVQSTLARVSYAISGVGPYTIPYYFLDNADIIVIRTLADNSGSVDLILNTDYTLTGAGDENGGSLTLVSPVDGDTLIIINEPPINQLTTYPEAGKFPADSHERALDKLTMIVKRANDLASRSLRLNDGDTATSVELPLGVAGEYLGFGINGELVSLPGTGSIADALLYLSSNYTNLAAWLTDYNLNGCNNADIGNNGVVLGIPVKLFINNGYEGGLANTAADHKRSGIQVLSETPDAATYSADHARNGINLTTRARGGQHGNAIRANLQNYSTFAGACTAVYSHAESAAGSDGTIALHAEMRCYDGGNLGVNVEMASYSALGTMYGMVLHNSTAVVDEITHPIEGTALTAHPSATALYILGNNNIDPKGGWVNGILFDDDSMRANGSCIKISAENVNYHFQTTGAANALIADIFLSGNSASGVVCTGTYTSGNAFRMAAGQALAFENTGNIRLAWDAGATSMKWYRASTTEVMALNMDATPTLSFNGTQILQTRITGWAADTGTAKRTANATYSGTAEATYTQATIQTLMNAVRDLSQEVKALKDDLITHGLIGA